MIIWLEKYLSKAKSADSAGREMTNQVRLLMRFKAYSNKYDIDVISTVFIHVSWNSTQKS